MLELSKKSNPLLAAQECKGKVDSHIHKPAIGNRETIQKNKLMKDPFIHAKRQTNSPTKPNFKEKNFHSPISAMKQNIPSFQRFYSPTSQLIPKK